MCDSPDQARDDVALGLFGCLENRKLLGRQMTLDGLLHENAQLVWLDGVKLDGNLAEILCSCVAGLGRAGRQIPVRNLLRCDGDAFENNVGIRRHLSQSLLDLLTGIDAGRVEVAEVIDVGRNIEGVDVLGRAVQERK